VREAASRSEQPLHLISKRPQQPQIATTLCVYVLDAAKVPKPPPDLLDYMRHVLSMLHKEAYCWKSPASHNIIRRQINDSTPTIHSKRHIARYRAVTANMVGHR